MMTRPRLPLPREVETLPGLVGWLGTIFALSVCGTYLVLQDFVVAGCVGPPQPRRWRGLVVLLVGLAATALFNLQVRRRLRRARSLASPQERLLALLLAGGMAAPGVKEDHGQP